MGQVVQLAEWEWRRPRRTRTRLQRALAGLELAQRDAVLDLLTLFGWQGATIWADGGPRWHTAGDAELVRPLVGIPLAEFPDEGLIALCLEAGYSIGDADTFKAVLPYFLAAALARPLQAWVVEPDLLKAKLEMLGFDRWPSRERRAVARALAVYAQHEIDLADSPTVPDESLVAAKRWAEAALAAAR